MKARNFVSLMLLAGLPLVAAEGRKSAKELLDSGAAEAAANHKNVLVVYHASWCGWCHKFDGMLADNEVGPALAKYFVVVHLDVQEANEKKDLETPGGGEAMAAMGGASAGLPFLAMLDPSGKVVTTSMRPVAGKKDENIGYPNQPYEIDWFMQMLKQAAPGASGDEVSAVQGWLKRHAT